MCSIMQNITGEGKLHLKTTNIKSSFSSKVCFFPDHSATKPITLARSPTLPYPTLPTLCEQKETKYILGKALVVTGGGAHYLCALFFNDVFA